MKRLSLHSAVSVAAVVVSIIVGQTTHAATLYWDTNGATGGVGGDGTWQDTTGNWSTDVAGTLTTTWTNANRDVADFRGTSGAVTIHSGGVAANSLIFNTGGYTLSGSGTITLGRSAAATSDYTVLNYATGSTLNTISPNMVINDSDSGTASVFTFNNSSSSDLTIGGNITVDYGTPPTGTTTLNFVTAGSTSSDITLDGQILSAAANGGTLGLRFGNATSANNGSVYVNGDNSVVTAGTLINGGTVVVSNANSLGSAGTVTFGSSGAHTTMKLLTGGAVTIGRALSMSGAADSQTYIGGSTADDSTFSGGFNMNAFGTNGSPGTISTPDPIFTAVAGGRVNFSGVLAATAGIPRGIIKEGAGIVALTSASGNTYKGFTRVNEGTLLLMNATGSATGDGSQLAPGTAGVIVAGGATLGGTGISTVLASAAAANSFFAPGDMTKEGVGSIGTLNLTGGLLAASGATFNIQVNGASTDTINFGAGMLDLDGTATFTFASLGTVQSGSPYTLFTGTGDWSGSAPSFVFNAPSGYSLDTSYGGGNGYVFDSVSGTRSLSVQFGVIPEPSTVGMLLGGLGVLGFLRRSRRRQA